MDATIGMVASLIAAIIPVQVWIAVKVGRVERGLKNVENRLNVMQLGYDPGDNPGCPEMMSLLEKERKMRKGSRE